MIKISLLNIVEENKSISELEIAFNALSIKLKNALKSDEIDYLDADELNSLVYEYEDMYTNHCDKFGTNEDLENMINSLANLNDALYRKVF